MAISDPRPIRGPRKDITGQKFGRWTVVSFAGDSFWNCRCDCGTNSTIRGPHLKGGHSKSCGCHKRDASSARLSARLEGDKYGRLTVLRRDGSNTSHNAVWLCVCECGNEARVSSNRLKSGNTQSCGCLQRDRTRTHGRSKTKVYRAWVHMHQRCVNPNTNAWEDYGGRGITVCERWAIFENFYADMGDPPPRHSLDRIDFNGNYEPGNCRWATSVQQAKNTRRNKFVTLDGVEMNLSDAIAKLRATAKYK